MKKYMKPALKAAFVESQDMIAQSPLGGVHNELGGGPNLSNRYEEDEFLDEFFEKEDFNPWKRK